MPGRGGGERPGQRAGGLRRGTGVTHSPASGSGASCSPRRRGRRGRAGWRRGEPGLGPGAPPPPEEEEEPPEPPPLLPPPREPNSSELPPRGALWVTRAARSVGATLRRLGDGAGGDAGPGRGRERAPPCSSHACARRRAGPSPRSAHHPAEGAVGRRLGGATAAATSPRPRLGHGELRFPTETRGARRVLEPGRSRRPPLRGELGEERRKDSSLKRKAFPVRTEVTGIAGGRSC